MIKKRIFGNETKKVLLQAAQELFTPVASTLGPKGKTVMISTFMDEGHYTKDGVTVAGEVQSADPFVNAGIKIFRGAAKKTVDDAGDGTTTSTILACTIIKEINNKLNDGRDILEIKNELQTDLQSCINNLNRFSTPIVSDSVLDIEKLKHIASISANNDEFIGGLIAGAYEKLGADTTISLLMVKDSTRIETTSGMRIDRGFTSPYFANIPDKGDCFHPKPLVFVTDKVITKTSDILKVIEYAIGVNMPLIVFCTDMAGEALGTLNNNVRSGTVKFCSVSIPFNVRNSREILKDIAIFTGATFFTEEAGHNMDNITHDDVPEIIGSCNSFQSSKDNCLIVGGNGQSKEIKERTAYINSLITAEISDYDKELLLSRKSKLNGGIAILYAGAKTESESKELFDRCEDAILAVRSALEEGYLPGGGKAYLLCALLLSDGILSRSLRSILYQICINADVKPDKIIHEIELNPSQNFGYNAKTDVMEDLCIAGVVDSTKVVRCALENAVSIGFAFLNTDCIIAEFKD